MNKLVTLLAVAALSLTACVPSIRPFHSRDTLVSDPALVGRYADPDSEESWTFTWDGDAAYHLTIVEHGKTGQFKAHLMALGDQRFLDLMPIEMPGEAPDFYRMHLVPSHTLLWVGDVGERLELAVMDPQWVEEYLEAHPGALAHTRSADDRVVLTASTPELQAFVRQHVKQLFDDPGHLMRAAAPKDS